ncbi:MAG: toxin-antitoxin (TA) system antitoxin [Deltaproteobacteria bacterium]|nr:toxin-antitoxin (TA) system antitoxin [Deltaproteobacteria bacterium]
MTKTVDIKTAKSQLAQLLTFALKGNEIIITDHDTPRAKIVPIPASRQSRIAGLNKGKIHVSKDFDEPLSDRFWTGAE